MSSVSTSHIRLFLLLMTIHSVFLHLIFTSFSSSLITVVRFKRNIKMSLLGPMNLKPNERFQQLEKYIQITLYGTVVIHLKFINTSHHISIPVRRTMGIKHLGLVMIAIRRFILVNVIYFSHMMALHVHVVKSAHIHLRFP